MNNIYKGPVIKLVGKVIYGLARRVWR